VTDPNASEGCTVRKRNQVPVEVPWLKKGQVTEAKLKADFGFMFVAKMVI
jgi:hypothetical protein